MMTQLKTKVRSLTQLFALTFWLLSAATSSAETIKAISFNIWGVPLAAYDLWRFDAAMDEMAQMNADFIGLQEVFTPRAHRNFWHPAYPYTARGVRAPPRLISSGLRLLSKHPIEWTATLVYRTCKKDDCLSRKGALLALARLPSGKKVNVVVTHLNARGEDWARQDQLDQLKLFIDYYRDPKAPLVILGDLNFSPESPLYPKMLSDFSVQDAWTQTQSTDPGYTNDCDLNTYARRYAERYNFPIVRERIDYILTQGATAIETKLIFNEPTQLRSDHFGIIATLEL